MPQLDANPQLLKAPRAIPPMVRCAIGGTARHRTGEATQVAPAPDSSPRPRGLHRGPKASHSLRALTFVPADRVGDAIRAYLGDQTTAHVQVWPIWEQNIIICSTTVLPQAQQLLGDFQLLVGDQQLPVRG
ncbi:hypothetical protein HPB50_011352 [Hyalomma asiaticum]|uniref:Uncharacterized protein n=1 Tax=Hyalomma asiaticum TaxID=266040 RepID=A0ACB7TG97_HYAAI|nr:hypothetical protein HPB50_011352 [Hyalomma asiaticum]